MSRLPLRLRVALGYGLIGLSLSLAFATAVSFMDDDYEELFVSALLRGQAPTYLQRLARNPHAVLPRSPEFAVYRPDEAPRELRGLGPGEHEVDLPGHEGVHVGVFGAGADRLVFVLDVGQVEALERYQAWVMALVVLGGTVLSAWLGLLFAGRSIRPVNRLARAVEALPLRPVPTSLADDYGKDGVGALALAIDGYQARLVDADAHERRFFADASHELRTPLAVIQGAVEVLRDDVGASAGQAARLDRIDRGVSELAILLEAVLLSARGLPDDWEPLDLDEACRRCLARLQSADPALRERLRVRGDGPRGVLAPRRWVASLLDVLMHRLLAAYPQARWDILLSPEGLHIDTVSDAAEEATGPGRSDLGIGIVFAERLARALGWRVVQSPAPGGGLRVSVLLPESARTTP